MGYATDSTSSAVELQRESILGAIRERKPPYSNTGVEERRLVRCCCDWLGVSWNGRYRNQGIYEDLGRRIDDAFENCYASDGTAILTGGDGKPYRIKRGFSQFGQKCLCIVEAEFGQLRLFDCRTYVKGRRQVWLDAGGKDLLAHGPDECYRAAVAFLTAENFVIEKEKLRRYDLAMDCTGVSMQELYDAWWKGHYTTRLDPPNLDRREPPIGKPDTGLGCSLKHGSRSRLQVMAYEKIPQAKKAIADRKASRDYLDQLRTRYWDRYDGDQVIRLESRATGDYLGGLSTPISTYEDMRGAMPWYARRLVCETLVYRTGERMNKRNPSTLPWWKALQDGVDEAVAGMPLTMPAWMRKDPSDNPEFDMKMFLSYGKKVFANKYPGMNDEVDSEEVRHTLDGELLKFLAFPGVLEQFRQAHERKLISRQSSETESPF